MLVLFFGQLQCSLPTVGHSHGVTSSMEQHLHHIDMSLPCGYVQGCKSKLESEPKINVYIILKCNEQLAILYIDTVGSLYYAELKLCEVIYQHIVLFNMLSP